MSAEATRDERGGGDLSTRLTAWAAAWLIRVMRRTLRLRYRNDATIRAWEREERRFLIAFWHRHNQKHHPHELERLLEIARRDDLHG